jgi:manganese/zinc/iron transport system permease protein
MSMMGDAISHAVLPGLAGGFLLVVAMRNAGWVDDLDARNPMIMLGGAAIVGVLTAVFTQWISGFGRVDRGAAMGIVFTTLFAIGLLLIRRAADHVDLDADCVLYGAIVTAAIDVLFAFEVAGVLFEVPRAVVMLGGVMLANLLIIAMLFKEFRLSAFDPELATTLGINANVMHYLLMTMVAITTVASFEAVGSIIVIAMLIVPAATAYLLTDRLLVMLTLSVIVGAVTAPIGHLGAINIPRLFGIDQATETSGTMAAVLGVLFALAWLFSPKHGLVVRKLRRHQSPDDQPEAENAATSTI